MQKRGLSSVVTALIIILLVIVAAGIVWVVISNVIKEGTEDIYLGKLTISLDIKDVRVQTDSVDVKVKRNPGRGELVGIKFFVNDGVRTEEFEMPTTINELGEQTFVLDYVGLVKEVSIAPMLKLDSGKEVIGNEADKKRLPNKKIIENLGAISWWRFEGNANDEIGGNNGLLVGGVDCNVGGKFGSACDFDGVNDYIDLSGRNLDHPDTYNGKATVSLWIKPNSHNNGFARYIAGFHYLWINSNGRLQSMVRNGGVNYWLVGTSTIPIGEWTHVVYQLEDGVAVRYYLNGSLDAQYESSDLVIISYSCLSAIGVSYNAFFNGSIDEPMVFNRILSEDEVRALYRLDLS